MHKLKKAVFLSLLFMNGNGLCGKQPFLFTFLVTLTSGLWSPGIVGVLQLESDKMNEPCVLFR